eukprot:2079034-Prymnesium_polylepis.1
MRVRAGRGRRAAERRERVLGYAPRDAMGQCGLAPPRTHPPRTGHPEIVTGSGLSTHGEWRPRGGRAMAYGLWCAVRRGGNRALRGSA